MRPDQFRSAVARAGFAPHEVRQADEPPMPEGPEDYGYSAEADEAPAQHVSKSVKPLRLIRPSEWRGKPLRPREWLATNRIPAGDATILSGDGSAGKTTVALQLAVAVAAELGDWLGTTCQSGPVLFFSAEEDEDEMRRRLERVARSRGLEPTGIEDLPFHFPDLEECILGALSKRTGLIEPTPQAHALVEAALDIRPAAIMVDSVAATFGGNQNDRAQVRRFVNMFRDISRKTGCAVLLLDHPSLTGITTGTGRGGSMDWQNAARARLYLKKTIDEDGATGRTLEVMKANYGIEGEKVNLRWEDGCYVLEGSTPAPAVAAAEGAADRIYLECLDVAVAQARNVFVSRGHGYAPNVFADMPEAKAKGMRSKALAAAQDRLLRAGLIHNEPFGPPSRGSRRIARKPSETAL